MPKGIENLEADDIGNVEFEVKEVIRVDDGKHKGTIKDIVYEMRKDFTYLDFYIDLDDTQRGDGTPFTVKTGFPANISEISSLGRFLALSGMKISSGDKITLNDMKKHLVGKKVVFQTFTGDSGFSDVLNKTLMVVS